MKRILILLATVSLFACKRAEKHTTKDLLGKWVVTELPGVELTAEEREQVIGKATIEFLSDGKYAAIDKEGTENGSYRYDDKKNRLTMFAEDSDTTEVQVSFADSLITFTREDGVIKMKRIKQAD